MTPISQMTPVLNSFMDPRPAPLDSIPESAGSGLQGRVTAVEWNEFVSIFGGVWIALLIDALFKLINSVWACVETPEREGAAKACTIHAVTFGGTLSNAMHWADSESLISIGRAAPFAKALGYGSSAILALIGAIDAVQTFFSSGEVGESITQRQLLALLSLGYRATSFAWSVLGVTSFAVGATLVPTIGTVLFLVSFLFYIAEIVYHHRILQAERVGGGPLPQPV